MRNGEYRVRANGIDHWCRVAGAENGTVPLVVVHGGPGGNVYNFERTVGPLLEEFATVQVWEIVDRPTVDRFLFHDAEAAALNRRLWEESGLTNTGDMYRALSAQPSDPGRFRHIRNLRVPTLVMVGRHDRNVGVEVCRQLGDELPDARLVVFENSAHFPDIEEPLAYAAAVRDFMTT